MLLARGVGLARLTQIRRRLALIDPSAVGRSRGLSRLATCLTLSKLYCACDHPGLFAHARTDYLLAGSRRLARLGPARRECLEAHLAEIILKIHIRYRLDRLLTLL